LGDDVEPGVYGRGSFANYLPWGTGGVAAGSGVGWVVPSGGVSFEVLDVGVQWAVVRVAVDPSGGLSDVSGPVFALPPVLERVGSGRTHVLWVPKAWDQSGVRRTRVFVDGKRVAVSPVVGVSRFESVVWLKAKRGRKVVVCMVLRDALGNRSLSSVEVPSVSR